MPIGGFPIGGGPIGGAPGAPESGQSYEMTMTAGAISGGITVFFSSRIYVTSEGAILGGEPSYEFIQSYFVTGSEGIISGGAASHISSRSYIGSEGIISGGAASHISSRSYIGSEGIISGGEPSYGFAQTYSISGSGGSLSGGEPSFFSSLVFSKQWRDSFDRPDEYPLDSPWETPAVKASARIQNYEMRNRQYPDNGDEENASVYYGQSAYTSWIEITYHAGDSFGLVQRSNIYFTGVDDSFFSARYESGQWQFHQHQGGYYGTTYGDSPSNGDKYRLHIWGDADTGGDGVSTVLYKNGTLILQYHGWTSGFHYIKHSAGVWLYDDATRVDDFILGSVEFDFVFGGETNYIKENSFFSTQGALVGGEPEIVFDISLVFTPEAGALVGGDPSYEGTQSYFVTGSEGIITGGTFAAVRVMIPDGDISLGTWIPSAGSGLYPMVDEYSPPDDNDYIRSSSSPSNDICTMDLKDVGVLPNEYTAHTLVYRYRKYQSGDQMNLTAGLYEGDTLVKSAFHSNVGTEFVTNSFTLTSGEIDSIISYDNLRVRLTANTGQYEQLYDANGEPMYDANGEPIYVKV